MSLTVSVLSILCIRERRLIIDGDCRCSPPIESVDQTPPENSEQDDSPQTEEEQIEALLNMGHEIEREGKEFVLIRSSGLISPNRYTTQRYLEGYEGVLIFYNESNNTLVIKPVNNYEPDEGRKFPPPLNLETSELPHSVQQRSLATTTSKNQTEITPIPTITTGMTNSRPSSST